MKRKIITALLLLLLLSASGVSLATYFITHTTTTLSRLVTLHQIEDHRQHLIISIQTVQSDLYTVKTMLGKNIDAIVDNVNTLEASASECTSCHHEPAITLDLHEIEALIMAYQDALSFYITASANRQRIEKLKLNAAEIGNDILKKIEAMSFRAAEKLEIATITALKKIRQARFILFSTIGFTFVFGLLIAIHLIRSVTRPIKQLVTATRAIAGGDLDHTVTTRDKDEFGELADHFNAMSITLKKNYEILTKEMLERKQAQINLAAEKERLAVTLRSIGDGVITTDNDGLVVLINKTAELLTGWRQEEASGRTVSEVFNIISEKTGEPRENPVEKVLKTGSIVLLANHTALISKDGTRRSIADSGAPILDRESRIVGVVLVFRDVTEANKMEEELFKVKKLESIGVLAGGIAHD
ncbi:MAG: PAS domain S-box protein, partial [Gammaproteobacteria bacterium]|nr:PAS domain S-box protein [Gammaproteobacteria bacterium]